MITKSDRAAPTSKTSATALIALLALAWLLLPRAAPATAGESSRHPFADGPFAADDGRPAGPVAGSLPRLRLDFAPEHARALRDARDRAITQGMIVQSDGAMVPARVALDGTQTTARVRLKGDWTDHVDTDRWSLRIEIDRGSLRGMSRFSIQHPKTRGFVMEWLIMAAARREGLLAPRSFFVQVEVDGRPSGVYYLEEHFSKELLESQGRRDGPIVRFREDTLWDTWLQYGSADVPPSASFATSQSAAEIAAYDEARLGRVRALNDRLQRALEQMRDLQRLAMVGSGERGVRELAALDELQGRTIDELFVAEKLGRMIALYSVFNAYHGFSWLQLRLYHDPVLDRLEPIVFDTGANPLYDRTDVLLAQPGLREILRSQACYEATFRALGEFTEQRWIDGLFAAVGGEFDRISQSLKEDGLVPGGIDFGVLPQRLRANAQRLRTLVEPRDPANFTCRMTGETNEYGTDAGFVVVEAWATTMTPVRVESFRFSNGRVVPAGLALSDGDRDLRRAGDTAVLPRAGRRVLFRFPVDERLAGLRTVQQIKDAVRQQVEPDRNVKVRIDIAYRPIAATTTTTERLRIRRSSAANEGVDRGRPPAPDLATAVEQHECLAYDARRGRLFLREGEWNVDGDLIVPAGMTLHASPGTTLRFAAGAVLASNGPLAFIGTPDRPIRLEPHASATAWGGLLVSETETESKLECVRIRSASSLARGGWQTTGGVTFYRAPVAMRAVHIENALGEDALNVFGTTVSLLDCTLRGGASDLFDGDFVNGRVERCTFADSGEDALDFSGSNVEVSDCRFERIGDKALSIGERSVVTAQAITVDGASIAAAAKDASRLRIETLNVRDVQYFTLAAFIKKDEFGPATIEAFSVRGPAVGDNATLRHLVQNGCSASIDGVALPTQPVDVPDLYRRKVLGK